MNGGAQQHTSTAVAGRKTFYISDYQKAKQQRDLNNLNGGRSNGTEDALNTSGISQQQSSQHQPNNYFHKPRALSRQGEANIKIEVHRDETIINHL